MQYGVYVFGGCRSPSAETVVRATALDVPLKYPWSDLKRIKVGYGLLHSLPQLAYTRNQTFLTTSMTPAGG
ncbi:hypothetical protein BDR05DRAFT_955365 [Suillus weaverae]|nr:hypothetical protein BDR05DRAFT_955365 [Suillus weaverae]